MKAVLQRVQKASVKVDNKVIGQIGPGFLVLLGVKRGDGESQVDGLLDKIINLRVFPDEEKKMNKPLLDINGELLVVSQFTLYANCEKGRRPSFIEAAEPELAEKLYELFIERARQKGIKVETGKFRAMMQVELVNDGPVTIVLESNDSPSP
jgi:D-tyrosyl-tRNA(Tyr) deacylase